ncbi:MAG TPA: sulfatase-like hydrolase/transferase [Candidatus Dormibacteraeota bacterium]|nr:sulfatase-like hydrolase/transferase [Candidatus Dormibacteraeota bacterium]
MLWPVAAQAVCVGDCAGAGAIGIDDLVRGVAIALGTQPLANCTAFDGDGDGQVTVAELVQGVNAALGGCPPAATASATVSATASNAPATATATPTVSQTALATHSGTATATSTPTATPATADSATSTASPTATLRPNILVVDLDDTRFDGIDRMPTVLNRLAAAGVSFSNSFVPNSVCCPSRASMLSGLYSFHHGTRAVAGDIGGADTFRVSGTDQRTMATWLHQAGYTTGLFGKYLNDYSTSEEHLGAGGSFYVPPGWDRWQAFQSPEHYGGVNGQTYELVDETGAVQVFDDHTTDAQYSTDVLASRLRDFIASATQQGQPFLAVFTPYASHSDVALPEPAQRHQDLFKDLPPWRPPSWNEPDISDKPHWVSLIPPDLFGGGFTDAIRIQAYQSLVAVDEQLDATLDLLAAQGVEDRTLVLFTSDNGTMWGEHRAFVQRKENPYEEAIRVPMIVRYPRVTGDAAITRAEPVLNIDVAATVADAADVVPPVAVDGESLMPLLSGGPEGAGRGDFLLEHFRQTRGDALAYSGQPSDGDQVRVIYGPTRQRPRLSQLFEFDSGDGVQAGARAVPIGATSDLSFFNLSQAIKAALPSLQVLLFQAQDFLAIGDLSPALDGALFSVAVDLGGVMRPGGAIPDYYGVRDVTNGYTYVEYETEEVELYDLDADPWQLDNRADDPAYAGIRATLAARLRQLLGEQP